MNKSILKRSICSVLLECEKSFPVSIIGTSMSPAINTRDTVKIVPFRKLRKGCCYVFQKHDSLLLHRLIASDRLQAHFMGDNCLCVDTISPEAVIGEAVIQQSPAFRFFITLVNRLLFLILQKKRYGHVANNSFSKLLIRSVLSLKRKLIRTQHYLRRR